MLTPYEMLEQFINFAKGLKDELMALFDNEDDDDNWPDLSPV